MRLRGMFSLAFLNEVFTFNDKSFCPLQSNGKSKEVLQQKRKSD